MSGQLSGLTAEEGDQALKASHVYVHMHTHCHMLSLFALPHAQPLASKPDPTPNPTRPIRQSSRCLHAAILSYKPAPSQLTAVFPRAAPSILPSCDV